MYRYQANKNKNLIIEVGGEKYARIPVKTHVVKDSDKIDEVVAKYLTEHLKEGDIIFVSEKIVAITQGRAFPVKDIKPSRLAKFLVTFVHKSPYGIGLGSPWTMELAIREAGILRIFLALIASVITKPFGIRGVFYIVGGRKIAAIDGPCDYTIPPYNKYAKLGPEKPNKVARELKEKAGHEVVIIDANDLGVAILGRSSRDVSIQFAKEVFRDNPLGQTNEQTPLCIVRKVNTPPKPSSY